MNININIIFQKIIFLLVNVTRRIFSFQNNNFSCESDKREFFNKNKYFSAYQNDISAKENFFGKHFFSPWQKCHFDKQKNIYIYFSLLNFFSLTL